MVEMVPHGHGNPLYEVIRYCSLHREREWESSSRPSGSEPDAVTTCAIGNMMFFSPSYNIEVRYENGTSTRTYSYRTRSLLVLNKVGRDKLDVSMCFSIAFVLIEPLASVACTMQENTHFSGSDNSLIPRSCSIANINSLSCVNVLNLLMCTKSP